jgi:tetratricopeptide (TPR) repeat protein
MVDHSSYDGDSNAIRQSQKNAQIPSPKNGMNSKEHLNMILNDGINSGYGAVNRSSVVANVGGAAQFITSDDRSTIQPAEQVNESTHIKVTKKTKRRLLWRVGPLQRKKNQAAMRKATRQGSNGSLADDSTTAKSIKSFHTFHSESTAKVGNSQRGLQKSKIGKRYDATSQQSGDKMLGFIPSNLNNTVLENTERGLVRNRDTLNGTPNRPPRPPSITPESTKTAETVSSSISYSASVVGREDIDVSDSGTVMGIESQDEDSGISPRMIGFSLPENSTTLSDIPISITTLSPSTGLQPRSPLVSSSGTDDIPMTPKIDKARISRPPLLLHSKCLMDDEISEAESEGPLWQLARLQAMSEGPISPPSSNSEMGQSSMLSSSSSVITTQSDSEVQTRHAERNLKAIHTLALRHLAFKEYTEAIEVFEEMLRGIKEIHGCDHYRVGTVLHNIATVCMKAKDYLRAADMCKLAIDIRSKALGPSHPHLSVSLAQLGIAHLELQNYREAVEAFGSALNIRRRHLSPSDLHIARLLNNIGCAEFELNNYGSALKAFEEAIDIQRTNMRSTIPGMKGQSNDLNRVLLSIAAAQCNIGSIKLRCRLYDQSLLALEEALLIQESVFGDNHATVLNTKESIKFVNKASESQSNVVIVSNFFFVITQCFHASDPFR